MNVVDLFARHDPDDLAFVCDADSQTYGQLAERVEAARTQMYGLAKQGSNIVVIGETSIDYIVVMFAALSVGLPVLPLTPRYPKAEIARAIELAQPKLIVSTDSASAALARGLDLEHVSHVDLIAAADDADDPDHDADAATTRVEPVDLPADHPALLMFTSGTAGSPRVAVLSHGNIAASIRQSRDSAPGLTDQHQVILGVMPLTHVLGLVSVVAVAVSVGATVVLTSQVDVDSIAETVHKHQVTFLVAPPVFWYRLGSSDVEPELLSSVKYTLSGAAPLSDSVATAVLDRFGLNLRQGYGLTEASPGLTSAVGTEAPATSVGRPMPGVKLRLVDEFGTDVPLGDVGEIWAKGDNIFVGYLGDPEATASVIDADGWLHTGDLAVVDQNGFLFIVGRNKDQIIVSGFNVHPGEVEDRLTQHHTVEAAAVVGEPDTEYGEVVVAYVVPARGMDPDPDVLEAHCRTALAGYKVPSRFEFVDDLPRGAAGKIRRRFLRS